MITPSYVLHRGPVLAGVLVAVLSAQTAWAQTIIDDFSVGANQASLDTNNGHVVGQIDMVNDTGPNIIGGERTVQVELTSGPGEIGAFVDTDSGYFDYRSSPQAAGNVLLIWDGTGASPLAANLRQAGGDTFRLQFALSEPYELPIRLIVNGTAVGKTIDRVVPELLGKEGAEVTIPFSEFNGVDFTQVNSIQLALDAGNRQTQDVLVALLDVVDRIPTEISATLEGVAASCLESGSIISYTATVHNTGQDFANNVVFTTSIDTDSTITGTPSTSQGTVQINHSDMTVAIGTMAPGQGVTIDYQAQIAAAIAPGTEVIAQGSVTADSGIDIATSMLTHIVTECTPSLEISKTAAPGCLDPNDPNATLTYTVDIVNTGVIDASAVTVMESLDACTVFAGALNGATLLSDNPLSFAVGDIAVGETATVSYAIAAGDCATPGGIFGTDSPITATSSNHLTSVVGSSDTERHFCSAQLDLSKTVSEGCLDPFDPVLPLSYTITVNNTGDGIASAVSLTDDLAVGLLLADNINGATAITAADGSLVFFVGDIPAGGSAVITYQASASAIAVPGAGITNTVTVIDTDLSATTNSAFCAPLLTIKKQVSSCLALDGAASGVLITIANDGNGMAPPLTVTNQLLDGDSGAGLISEGKVIIDPSSIAASSQSDGVVSEVVDSSTTDIQASIDHLGPGTQATISYAALLQLVAEDDPAAFSKMSFLSNTIATGVADPMTADLPIAVCDKDAPPVAVPTLNQWAMLLLSFLLGISAWVVIRDNKKDRTSSAM